ncbi:MAG TPA: PHP domain-containing protein [Candidatus Limnocylindrales bacterium]
MVRTRRGVPGSPVVPPGPSPVDLHTHTLRSDGVLSPRELVAAAAATGVRTLAITDHDTLAAARELAAQPGAIPAGLELWAGVEINTVTDRSVDAWAGELHLLGLCVDPDDDAFEALLAAQRVQRRVRFERMVARLRAVGIVVGDLAERLPSDERAALGRPTLGRMLVAKGYAVSVEDAFDRIIGTGGPGYMPRTGVGPRDAIVAIRAAGGLPVLAHTADAADRESAISELHAMGLGGLEVHYRRYDRETVASVAGVARRLRLVPTGGSDYHGDRESYAEAHARLWVPAADADAVRAATARQDTSTPG